MDTLKTYLFLQAVFCMMINTILVFYYNWRIKKITDKFTDYLQELDKINEKLLKKTNRKKKKLAV